MDTFTLNAITQELQTVCPVRINRICQPDEFSLTLVLWRDNHEQFLNISVDSRYQYIFLSSTATRNGVRNFGKLLQYHIKSARIQAVQKPLLERILTFDIVKTGIDRQALRYQLILELMGRHSNLILLSQPGNKILDSIRHVTAVQSSYRRIAPGAVYVPPPPQTKTDLLSLTRSDFETVVQDYHALAEKRPPFWKWLLQHIQGLSPLIAKDVAGPQTAGPHEQWQRLEHVMSSVRSGTYEPVLVMSSSPSDDFSRPKAVSAIKLHHRPCVTMESMNEAAERYYSAEASRQRYERLKTALSQPLIAKLAKLRKKQQHLVAQQKQIANAEQYKQQGDLITANIYQLKKGMREAEVVDYYSEGQPLITIELDPKLTPAQNAQKFFKRYNKLKQGKAITQARLEDTEQEIAALEERLFFVEEADTLEQVEALYEDYIEMEPRSKPRPKTAPAEKRDPVKPFLRFTSSDGFDIYVGRSSKENDLLTLRTAQSEDIWLHAQQAPGSHVLILNRERNVTVPKQTIREAAALAAYYSKLRKNGKVDVSYTLRKYVRKPKGSAPGLVTLSQFQTIRVMPKQEITRPPMDVYANS